MLLLWIAIGGCLHGRTPVAVPPPPAPPPSPVAAASTTELAGRAVSAASSAAPVVELTRIEIADAPADSTAPALHVVGPADRAIIDPSFARSVAAVLDVEALDPARHHVFLALDDHPAVGVTPAGAPIALAPLFGPLTPGAHRLVAYAVDERGRAIRARRNPPVSVVRFWVGEDPKWSEAPPLELVAIEPVLGDRLIWIDYYVIGAEIDAARRVKLEWSPPSGSVYEAVTDRWRPFLAHGAPPGRTKARLTVVDAEGKRIGGSHSVVERVVEVP